MTDLLNAGVVDISSLLSQVEGTIGSLGQQAVSLFGLKNDSDAATASDIAARQTQSTADQQVNSIQQAAQVKTKADDQLIMAQTGTNPADPNSTIYKYNEQNKSDLGDLLNVQNILKQHAQESWWNNPVQKALNTFTDPFYKNEAGVLASNITEREGLIQNQQKIATSQFGINATVDTAASNNLTQAQNDSIAAIASQYSANSQRQNNAFKINDISALDANTTEQLDAKFKANDAVAEQWKEQFSLGTADRQQQLMQAEVSLDETRSGVLGGGGNLDALRQSLLAGKTGAQANTIQNLPESQLLPEYKLEAAAGLLKDSPDTQNKLIAQATPASNAANIIAQFTSNSGLPDTPLSVLNKMAPQQRDAIIKSGTNLLSSGTYGAGAGDVWGAVSNLRDAGAPVSPAMSAVMKMIDATATSGAADFNQLNQLQTGMAGGFKGLSKEMQTGVLNGYLNNKFSSDLKSIPLDNSVYQPDTIAALSKLPALSKFSLMTDLKGISGGNNLYPVKADDVFNLATNEIAKNPKALDQMVQEITTTYNAMALNINSTRNLPRLGIQPLSAGTTGYKQLVQGTADSATGGSIVDMTNPSMVRNALIKKSISPITKGMTNLLNSVTDSLSGLAN